MKDIFSVAHGLNGAASGLQLLKFLHINVLFHFNFIYSPKNNLILVFHLQVNQPLKKKNKPHQVRQGLGGKNAYVAAEI